jgi:hypothetical protein
MGRPKTIYKTKARSFINFIASNIFDKTIKGYKPKNLIYDFNYNNDIIRLNISIQYFPMVGGIFNEGFDVHGSSSDEDIQMHIIIYTHNFKNTCYNEYNGELRSFLRHEIEHLAQYNDVSDKPNIYDSNIFEGTLEEYLLLPHEIDAFLYGLNFKRKYLKSNIINEIDTTLKYYYNLENDTFIKVRKVWIERLSEILPHTL